MDQLSGRAPSVYCTDPNMKEKEFNASQSVKCMEDSHWVIEANSF